MGQRDLNRREFIQRSAGVVGGALLVPLTARTVTAGTASDLVPLGRTGVKISRLGIGMGTHSGRVQREIGQAAFTRLVHEAFDRGITYIDTADSYRTHEMVREAIKGLPRERLFIQTKMPWGREQFVKQPLEVLDRYRKELGVDYIDSLLIHCTTRHTWPTDLRPMMDAFDEAKERKLIRLKGVSCHGLPALTAATPTDWVDVQLARVNPQGRHVDGHDGAFGDRGDIDAVMKELRAMHAKGRGIIGMKLVGNGDFTNPEDRQRAIDFAMSCGCVDAVVIGVNSVAQLDEAISRINKALAKS